MTVLGEAFIEVRGDLKPFIRDLDKEVKRAAESMEKQLRGAVGRGLDVTDKDGERIGDKLGDGVDRKMRQRLGDKRKPPWVNITAAFASALDDGISALPTEVKAAIVLGIIAALPIVSGALAGAITAAVGVGFAGLGAFIAFQYDEVRERGTQLLENLRLLLVDAASSFVPAMLKALQIIEDRFENWAPLLSRIFGKASKFVEPLTKGLLDFVDQILTGIDSSMDDTTGFIGELAAALRTLGNATGQFFKILANTGDSGREAFRDLIFMLANLIVNLAKVMAFLTEVYHLVRLIGAAIDPILGGALIKASDTAAGATSILGTRNHELAQSTDGVIKLTDEEIKRLKELDKALKSASDATYGIIQSQVDFERSLDNIREALQENGKTFDITNEKGRQNVEAFLKGLKDAEAETANQVAMGRLSSVQAAQYYDDQIRKVEELARKAGFTTAQFDAMFGEIINVAQLRLDAEAMGLTNTSAELQEGVSQARELYNQLQRIKNFRLPSQGTRRFSEYAEGGLVTQPTQALIGEAGAEVVIPLTRPARAAELMRLSGLDRMLAPAVPSVQVFVGNEQLDSRTYRIVTENNSALSSSLAFGARGL
jgi:ABC-type transporter Mla subunit MlaD